MSLVNDMLRDLDQRRKESDSSSGAVRLTPAVDYPADSRKLLLPLVLFALLLTSGGIWYYWDQLNQPGYQQQLDIQLQPAITSSDSPPAEIAEEAPVAIGEESSAANVEEMPVAILEEPSVATQVSSVELVRAEPELAVPATPEFHNEQIEQAIPVSNEIVKTLSEPVVNSLAELNTADIDEGDPTAEATVELANTVNLVKAEEVVDPIRDVPEFTSEQRDTIAVQEALGFFSNGQTNEAYTVLGQYIASNRYAHQSRETYAKLLMSRGEAQEAYALTDAGLKLAPNHRGFKKVKARLLMANGLIGEAADLLLSRAPDLAEDTEYHDLLATAQLSSKDYEGAVISYRGLVGQDPSQGKWWYGFAASQDNLGNTKAARQYYMQAIQYSNLSASLRRRSQERLSVLNP